MAMNNKETKKVTQCESCAYYDYDEEYDAYGCTINLEEDDVSTYYSTRTSCPYYSYYDEYKIVRKQN